MLTIDFGQGLAMKLGVRNIVLRGERRKRSIKDKNVRSVSRLFAGIVNEFNLKASYFTHSSYL